ncbi:MAG: M42 family metallopeptidase [Planctomycetes bacterium]|nr:M42 family metallopeptidase [Planctomycetota bacterium]
MNDESLALLKKLSELDGVSGFENRVRDCLRDELDGLAEFETDNLGSLICKKTGSSAEPRIMLPAHMDEIGFMVKDITDEGFIRFAPLGGWLDQTLLGHTVTVKTANGELPGVIGCTPPHLMPRDERKKVIERKTMFIDIGARDKEHAQEELGVRIGNPIIPRQPFERMADDKYLLGKAWDDRVGCALIVDIVKQLQHEEHPNTVFAVGTTQEEVGVRGAKTAVDVVDPHFCVVLDVGIVTDTPGIKDEPKSELGKGPLIYVQDGGTIAHHRFNEFVLAQANAEGIPYQLSLLEQGSTDARAIHVHARGVPSVLVGIPARYIHSHAGVIHTDDYDATLHLLLAIVRALSAQEAASLISM